MILDESHIVKALPGDERFDLTWIDAAYADADSERSAADFVCTETTEWRSAARRRAREIIAAGVAWLDVVEVQAFSFTMGVWRETRMTEFTSSGMRRWEENFSKRLIQRKVEHDR